MMYNKIPILLITLSLLLLSNTQYCSSACIDYYGACFDSTPNGCYVCANHIYNMNVVMTSSCSTLNQTSVVSYDLTNPALSLAGYTSTQTTPYTCGAY
jgi:hypothetical protein